MLAHERIYPASECACSRLLKAHGQTAHRGRAQAPKAVRPPTTHRATAPRQGWCWDGTYPPAPGVGRWFCLDLILDPYRRKIVGWEVPDIGHAEHAAQLVCRTALAQGIAAMGPKPVPHGDHGSTLKATPVLAMRNRLGVEPSESRPRVSHANAFAASLFRTAKYRPEFPAPGFAELGQGSRLGRGLRPLVQLRSSSQRHSRRQSGAAPRRR